MPIETIGLIDPVLQFIDANGAPYAAGTVTFYATGTQNLLAIYSDRSLSTALPNPLPLNAAGRSSTSTTGVASPVYFQIAIYDYVLKDANGVTIYGPITFSGSQWPSSGLGTAGFVLTSNGATTTPTFQQIPTQDTGVFDFRLTFTTNVPVTTADVTAATTIYLTPYKGNRLTLFSGGGVASVFTSAEMSTAVPATTSQMYDIFVYSNSGTPTLELLAWTNDTTRATAIATTTTGAYTKSGDLTRRYVGSFRTTGVSGQTEDSFSKRYLWNYYNRIARPLRVYEATDSWNYSLAAYQQVNASAANQVDMVIGVAESILSLSACAISKNDTSVVSSWTAIGEDGITPISTQRILRGSAGNGTLIGLVPANAYVFRYPAVGRHYYTWLERATASNTTTFYGDNGASTLDQTGIDGWLL